MNRHAIDEMNKCPVFLKCLCILMMIMAIAGGVSVLVAPSSSDGFDSIFLEVVVTIFLSIKMMGGNGWARTSYLVYIILYQLIILTSNNSTPFPSMKIAAISAFSIIIKIFVLYNKSSNKFFEKNTATKKY